MYFSNFSRRRICNPIPQYQPEVIPQTPVYSHTDCKERIDFINRMRLVWSQHVYWTRLLIISIVNRLMDVDYTTARLLENPGDLAKVFAEFYPKKVTDLIEKLVTEHLQIGAELITALRDGETHKAEELNKQWYENADKIADAFATIGYNQEEVRRMFYSHLDITKQETAMRLAGNYPADIAAFNAAEQEMLAMADMFIRGIFKQFPDRF
jgi:hypothetical protein